MSVKTDIVSGTVNVPFTFRPPAAQKSIANFVLYNQSPFILIVNIGDGALVSYCPAFTADIYEVNPQVTITITPVSSIGADTPLANQIFGIFYNDNEELPFSAFPASLFGSPESVLVDSPKLLAVELNRTTSGGFTSGAIDVRRYQSFQMSVQYEAANTGPPANTMLLDLEWADDASFSNVLYNHVYEINSFLTTDCGRTHITDAHHGPFMRYHCEPGNGAASTVSLVLYGSNRQVEKARLQENGDTDATGLGVDRTILYVLAETITPAVNLERNLRLAAGPAIVTIQTGAGGGSHDVVLYTPSLGINARVYSANIPAGINNRHEKISLPRRALTLFVNNNGAANSTFWMTVTADDD